jgi:probable rRNA maturation factor
MPIHFFYEETDYRIKYTRKTKQWIIRAAKQENRSILELNYVFCSDSFLLELNNKFLKHNSLTDIITFDSSSGKEISGEIYISIERVEENSLKFQSRFHDELKRVMIHGVLHLVGYKDKKPKDVVIMRKKEEAYLSLWKTAFHVKQ